MIPTVEQVKTRTLSLVDDDSQEWATNAKFQEAFAEGWDVLYAAMLERQIDRIKNVALYTLPAGTSELIPATAGISDFGELIEIRERLSGSTEDEFWPLYEWDILPQRRRVNELVHFVWRLDTLYFLGANTERQLQLHYYASGVAPTSGSVGVDASLTFLSRYSAAVLLDRNGQHALADRMMQHAVGRKHDSGILGGDLDTLIGPMLRAMQRRPIQPKPFTVTPVHGPPWWHPSPGGGGGSVNTPISMSVAAGTITGALDGSNTAFFLNGPYNDVAVYLDGVRLTRGVHYTHATNTLTFLGVSIPSATSELLVDGW